MVNYTKLFNIPVCNYVFNITYFFLTFFCYNTHADVYSRADFKLYFQGEVSDSVARAVLAYDSISLGSHNAERWALDQAHYIGFNDSLLTASAIIINTAVFKRISTKSIHFYYSPIKDLTLRPDIVYSDISKAWELTLTLNWRLK